MSTVIENGYKIPNMNLKELNDWVAPLRKIAEVETEKYVYLEMMKEAIYLHDLATVMTADEFNSRMEGNEGYDEDRTILTYVRGELRRQSNSVFRGDIDVKSKLVIFPLESKTIAILIPCDVKGIQTSFEQLPGVREYAYWNNVDKPKKLSEKEWEKRKDDWSQAIGYGDITKDGIVIELMTDIPLIFSGVPDVKLPSLSKRAKRIATHFVEKEFIARLQEESEKVSYHVIIDYFSSEEGVRALKEKAKELEKVLLKNVSMESLQAKFRDCFKKEDTAQ